MPCVVARRRRVCYGSSHGNTSQQERSGTAGHRTRGSSVNGLARVERARRLLEHGPAYIGNADLLAVFLEAAAGGDRLATAERLIAEADGLTNLGKLDVDRLKALGLTEVKARLLAAGIEIGRRCAMPSGLDRPRIESPEDTYHLCRHMADLEREQLHVLLLNMKNEVMRRILLYQGTINAASIRVSEILAPAVQLNMPKVIIVHNHPSGDPEPSYDDTVVTQKVVAAGELLDIGVLDHVVVATRGWVSMRQRRLGFTS